MAEDLVKEVTKMMGPSSDAAPIGEANQLELLDTVGNLIRVIKPLQDHESKKKVRGQRGR